MVTDSGIVTDFSDEQYEKPFINSTPFGISTEVRPLQLSKAWVTVSEPPSLFTVFGKLMLVNFSQLLKPTKDSSPSESLMLVRFSQRLKPEIDVTLLGISTSVKLVHPLNPEIVSIPSAKETSVKPVQSLKP